MNIKPNCARCVGTGFIRLGDGTGSVASYPCPTCHGAGEGVEAALSNFGSELPPDPKEVAKAKARHAAVEVERSFNTLTPSHAPCESCGGGGIVWEDDGLICPCGSLGRATR